MKWRLQPALSGAATVWSDQSNKDLSRACSMKHSRSAGRDTGAAGKGDRQCYIVYRQVAQDIQGNTIDIMIDVPRDSDG